MLINTNTIVETHDAKLPDDIDSIKKLWTDYLTWGNDQMQLLHGVHPHNPTEAVEQDIKMIAKFLPSNGRLILAFVDNKTRCHRISLDAYRHQHRTGRYRQ